MPINEKDIAVHGYSMPSSGINLRNNPITLATTEAIRTQNMILRRGLNRRGGQSLAASNEVVASTPINGLHRFLLSDGTKQTLAACETTVKYLNSGSWSNVKTGLTAGTKTKFHTWGGVNKVFMANGIDAPHSWDGTTSAAVSAAPATTFQFISYQDRLLSLYGGKITWSASYDSSSWETESNCSVKPDTVLYGACMHSGTNQNFGTDSAVLLAGANGMSLFYGTDLRVPSTTGNYEIIRIGTSVGCMSPKTMVWTPYGTMWLGMDRQVYLLEFDSTSPIPVGEKIRSTDYKFPGIEGIPDANLPDACACYWDGFYMLSFTPSGSSTNTYQFWLDLSNLGKDSNGLYGPWYGPMTGQNISVFCPMPDIGKLAGGEASNKGYVYYLHDTTLATDINPSTAGTKSVECIWSTRYSEFEAPHLQKDIHKIELCVEDTDENLTVDFFDLPTLAEAPTQQVVLGSTAYFWNDAYFGEQYWNDDQSANKVIDLSPALHVRRLSMDVTYSGGYPFKLYGLYAKITECSEVFEAAQI